MHVGIIGGGMMGLATGFYLSQKGIQVTILEKEKEIGGLSRSIEILPDIYWDRFYHVILSTDEELLDFIGELGLSLDVHWNDTKTGFYTQGRLYSMSNTIEFLKFPPLTLLDKLRLGAGILYASKIKNWKRLEKIYVKTWLTRVFGRRNYEKIWDPLLHAKLGAAKNQISASFIWATIKRAYGNRNRSSKQEQMGSVRGGYYSILGHLKDYLQSNGNQIITNCGIASVEIMRNHQIRLIPHLGNPMVFDRVVATIPNPDILRIFSAIPTELSNSLKAVSYLSIICVALVLRRSLTPFYVTNLTDASLPFTGLIEATNVIPKDILDDKTLIYLPKYIPAGDPFYRKSDEDVKDIFVTALLSMFHDLSEEDIITCSIHREPFVQPIQDIGYSEKIPSIETAVKNFYLVNTTMILNSVLNNNEVIKLAREAADIVSQAQRLEAREN